MTSLAGLDMLVLETIGRRTGDRIRTPLLYLTDTEGNYICAASYGGSNNHPSWFLNIVKSRTVHLQIGNKTVIASADILESQERDEAWSWLVDVYPPFAKYQNSTTRTIPVVRFNPSKTDNGFPIFNTEL